MHYLRHILLEHFKAANKVIIYEADVEMLCLYRPVTVEGFFWILKYCIYEIVERQRIVQKSIWNIKSMNNLALWRLVTNDLVQVSGEQTRKWITNNAKNEKFIGTDQ